MQAEGPGLVQSGEELALAAPNCSCTAYGALQESSTRHASQQVQERLRLAVRKLFHQKERQTAAQAAPGNHEGPLRIMKAALLGG